MPLASPMTEEARSLANRMRAALQCLAALLLFLVARKVAQHGAAGLVSEAWTPLAEKAMLAFLLLLGYASFGLVYNRQQHPVSAQGLPLRPHWLGELGMGLATGWALALLCVVPLALFGGIAIRLHLNAAAWLWLAADAGFFACSALVEEVALRGYGFQRLAAGFSPTIAVIGYTALYALLEAHQQGASHASIAVAIAVNFLLSTAYLRTRALWVGWGVNFAWKASRALLFGLAVNGVNSHSPVIQGDPMGPFWLTGGGFGLEASWLTFALVLLAIPALYRITRELDFQYNAPVIIPGGRAVDLDKAAREQHEAALGAAEAAKPALVQILPAAPAAQIPPIANGEADKSH